ncbi:Abi-alpha family protein [Sciscionella sediminilitoris]|uniref:Abi-alpha family protein n=1 Tax=Sciscionella sediminilitoris TaxID=1445613 RepID=UPI000A691CBC|nr:Abi-alpha family protein [Sciscionella sp. SE31]
MNFVQDASERARNSANELLRTAGKLAEASATVGVAIVRAAIEGQSPAELAQGAGEQLRAVSRTALGLPADNLPAGARPGYVNASALRAKGAALLQRSADVSFTESAEYVHPAYARIIDELAPDEARILRVFATDGAQPAIDVRTGRPFGVGSAQVAYGLSMIGELAGCRQTDKVPAYLNNLERLGLIWFWKEPVDAARYQVVEVQPTVTEAVREAGRAARTVRRSIALTPFGVDFCRICFPGELTIEGTASA